MKDSILNTVKLSASTKNILTLMSGTVIAQAIPIAITPILSRIYSEEDFGLLAIYVSIVTVISVIATGRYEMAILLPKKDEDAINVAALSMAIVTGFSVLSLFIVILFNTSLSYLFKNPEISIWLYWIPLSIFFLGLFNVLTYFNNRLKTYKDIASATIYKSLVLAFVQVVVGFLKAGAVGLISGNIISSFTANTRLLKNIIKNKVLRKQISFLKMKEMAIRFQNFPKYSMWAILANSLSVNLINILITPLYNAATLGFYYMVQRVLGLPVALVGSSISQVFLQEASEEKQKTGKANIAFFSTLKKLLLVGVPTFLLLFFTIEFIFVFFLGDNWAMGGVYARLLIPFFFTKFISSPMSVMLIVFEKQKMELFINLLVVSVSILSILFTASFIDFIYWFTGILSGFYILIIFYYYKLSKGGVNEPII